MVGRVGVDVEAVQGAQPKWVMDLIDWRRLALLTAQVVAKQPEDLQAEIMAEASEAEDGALWAAGLGLTPFDADGWSVVSFRGSEMLRLHVSNLLPLYDPYQELPEPEAMPGFYL